MLLCLVVLAAASLPTAAAGRPRVDQASLEPTSSSAIQLDARSKVPDPAPKAKAESPAADATKEVPVGDALKKWTNKICGDCDPAKPDQGLMVDVKKANGEGTKEDGWKGKDHLHGKLDEWKGHYVNLQDKAKQLRIKATDYLTEMKTVAKGMTDRAKAQEKVSLDAIKDAKKKYEALPKTEKDPLPEAKEPPKNKISDQVLGETAKTEAPESKPSQQFAKPEKAEKTADKPAEGFEGRRKSRQKAEEKEERPATEAKAEKTADKPAEGFEGRRKSRQQVEEKEERPATEASDKDVKSKQKTPTEVPTTATTTTKPTTTTTTTKRTTTATAKTTTVAKKKD